MKKALLLVDHGSMRQEANDMLELVAKEVQAKNKGVIVDFAHMELAEPSIAKGIENCVKKGASEVIVHPYMLSPGRHSTSDIPRMVDEVSQGYPDVKFEVTGPLGVHEKIAEVVLERAGLLD